MWIALTAALAQEPVPDEQARLYVEANALYEDGRYDAALELLATAERFGERNILHLARGRVYQRVGDCEQADREYLLALTAPPVPSPEPAAIDLRVVQYREELRQSCPASLEVRCLPPEARLAVDDVESPCGTFSVPPGTHRLSLTLGRSHVAQEVELRGLERRTVDMAVASSRGRPLVVGVLASGAALFAAGLLVDVGWLGPAQDRHDSAALGGDPETADYRRTAQTLRWTSFAGYASGVAMVGVGFTGAVVRRPQSGSSTPSSE